MSIITQEINILSFRVPDHFPRLEAILGRRHLRWRRCYQRIRDPVMSKIFHFPFYSHFQSVLRFTGLKFTSHFPDSKMRWVAGKRCASKSVEEPYIFTSNKARCGKIAGFVGYPYVLTSKIYRKIAEPERATRNMQSLCLTAEINKLVLPKGDSHLCGFQMVPHSVEHPHAKTAKLC